MTDIYTENLADFGYREISMLRDILIAWTKDGLPDDFDNSGVRPALNKNSGFVFLVNDEYQVVMLNGEDLESFYTLPYSGHEGFLSNLTEEYSPDELNEEDVQYVLDRAEHTGFDLPSLWSQIEIDRS